MVVTQHLRREGPVASSIRFKTRTTPELRYRVCFRLTRNDTVGVSMADLDDHVVRVLASGEPLSGGDAPHCFDWDGRADNGQPVPPGLYHLRLQLHDADRTAISGEQLRVAQ
jgi:flagellar hook assembly protein FlgD